MSEPWLTTKRAGIPCGGCGKAGTCTVSADGTAFKCWKDGGRVIQMGGRSATNGTDYVGRAYRPKPANGKPRVFPSAEAAIAAAGRSAGGGPPSRVWTYHNRDRSEAMRVVRFDRADGGKEFRPVHPVDGGWRIGDPLGPLPLYRLRDLPDTVTIYVCEGEKAADAAWQIGLPATTSAHGSSSAGRTDWSPLMGMDVVLLPDADEPGHNYAREVTRLLLALDPPARVRVVDLPGLPEGGDIVEFIAARSDVELAEVASEIVALSEAVAPAVDAGEGAGDKGEVWPEPQPLPAGLPPVPPFDYDLLPESLRPWVADVAERMQCPPDYCAATALVMSGMLIGRKLAVRPKRKDDWQVVPNLYGMMVGRPSLMKTPAMREVLRFAVRLEVEAKVAHEQALAEQAAAALVADARHKLKKEELKKAVKAGADTAQAIATEMAKGEDQPPMRARYVVNDATVEKLGVILSENPNGVLVFADELATFLRTMDREGHEGDRGFYLTAWDGYSRYTYDRIGRGTVDIEAAIASVVGSIQPGVVADYLQGAVHGGRGDDGLIQRFQLSVWPDVPRRWLLVDRYPDPAARELARAALQRLVDLTPLTVGAEQDHYDRDVIPFLRFDHFAQDGFIDWWSDLENRLRSGAEHPAIEAHLAKYRKLVPALALIFHVLDGGVGPIAETAVQRAVAWAAFLEAHARRLYAGVTEGPALAARLLAKRIIDGSVGTPFAARDVYRNGWAGLDRERTESAIDVLLSLGWLDERAEPTAGRTRTRYVVNPKVARIDVGGPTEPTEGPSVGNVSEVPEEFLVFCENQGTNWSTTMSDKTTKSHVTGDKPAVAKDALANPPAAKPAARELEKNPRLLHSVFLPGSMYRHMLKEVVGDDPNMLDTALRYVLDVMDELKPRDPIERMLAAQMVQTHVRQMYLTMMSTQQKHLKWAALMHESADRAANTFRRQMLALAEYRRPPRPARHFTAIGQANIANQQVVQNNGKLENGKATNEQGCVGEPKALPADGAGAGGVAALGGAGAAVGGEHRPADGGREGSGEPERAAAR